MKLEKKLLVIGIVSFILTMVLYFLDSDERTSSLFTTIFEIFLMTAMLFLVIAINFFAISFFVRKMRGLCSS